MTLLLATQNPSKKKEFATLFKNFSIDFVLPSEVPGGPFVFPEESGTTFIENAYIKAESLHRQTQLDTLSDDSGISVRWLNDFPGVKSARWLPGTGKDRVTGLLKKLENVHDRSAYFTCVLCLIMGSTNAPLYFEGTMEGSIATEARGSEGFDYDVLFIPAGESKTLAELGSKYKNAFSHRAQALEKLRVFLEKYYVKLGDT